MIFEGFLFTLAASGMVYSILLALRWKQESRLIFGERRTDFHSAAMATTASSGERATGSGAATGTGTMSRAAAMRRKKFTITWNTLRASPTGPLRCTKTLMFWDNKNLSCWAYAVVSRTSDD